MITLQSYAISMNEICIKENNFKNINHKKMIVLKEVLLFKIINHKTAFFFNKSNFITITAENDSVIIKMNSVMPSWRTYPGYGNN